MRFLVALTCACIVTAACDKKWPAPPFGDPGAVIPAGTERITGTERIGWDEQAASPEELATFQYLIYVDGTSSVVQNVNCASGAGPAGFSCTGRLPSLTPGQHALALSAFIDSGGARLESVRSSSVLVFVVPSSTSSTSSAPPRASAFRTVDGVELRAMVVAEGLERPSDLAVAPDGRIYIAERPGRIRVFRNGRLTPASAITLRDVTASGEGDGLLTLTLDPEFDRNHLLYAVYTTSTGFRLARFRAVGDTLGDRAILLDAVPSSLQSPAASLRFGPDGKLYVGLDNAGLPARSGDLGSFNGKILRLNADGTTPADRRDGSPVFGADLVSPRGLEWAGDGATLWVADDTLEARSPQGAIVSRYRLPGGAGGSALALYRGGLIPAFRGNLLVIAEGGGALLRLTLAPADPQHVIATEPLFGGAVDDARAVAVGRDGAVYLAASGALLRVAPQNP